MVKFSFALICVLLLQLSKASCQTNWKFIGTSHDSTECYVSCDKIVKRINSAVIWVKYICKPDSITQKREAVSSGVKYVLYDNDVNRKIFDFKNNRRKILSFYRYLNGSVVYELQINEKEAVWHDIIPDSFEDVEFTFFKKYLHMKN